MGESEEKKETQSSTEEKKHVCSVCGKPSESIICHACEDKLRADALDQKKGGGKGVK